MQGISDLHLTLSSWIRSYADFLCGPPPDNTNIVYLWCESPHQRLIRTEKPVKIICGWGMRGGGSRSVNALTYAEKFRMAYYQILVSVQWSALDWSALRKDFKDDAYAFYLEQF